MKKDHALATGSQTLNNRDFIAFEITDVQNSDGAKLYITTIMKENCECRSEKNENRKKESLRTTYLFIKTAKIT